jgi:non-canonical poly(A) RNA polymerase PAPD5/7
MTTEKELDPIPIFKPIQKSNSNDIYIKFPRLSLIIDTDFNDNDKTLSTQKKIDYLNQTNKNKKYLLTLLKSSEFKIIEQTKFIQEEILKNKNKLKEMKIQLEKKSNLLKSNDDYEQNLDSIKTRINKGKEIIEEKRQNLIQEQKDSIINIPKESKSLYKYSLLLNLDFKKELVYSQLKLDLIDFMNYVHARNAKLESTLQKINSLIEKSVLESLGKEYQLHMYGSRATKLCLPWSDIDYVISYTKNNYIDPLKILYDYLYTIPERFFIDMKYIPGASIPVLKIFTNNEYHKISLDISMENQEHHGEECVNYIKNKIKEFEVLTPITFALKTILQKAFLNDPYKGGLSSYGVILLIINFLNVQNKRGNDITMNSLGKLFYDILYYYGFEHDVSNPIIIDDKTDLDKVYFFHQFQIYKKEFILVDPLNIANNVAKNTRQYQNIKLAFKIGYASFLESCECGCHYQYDGINIKEDGCEHNLLVRIFNDVKRE